MEKKLYKSSEDKVLAGVCGGIAEYFNVDTVVVRLAWVVFTLMGGAGLIAYIIAAIILPENPGFKSVAEDFSQTNVNSPSRKNTSGNTSIVLGIFLMLFGSYLIFKHFVPWIPRDFILAMVLIGLGVFFIIRKKQV